MIIYDNDNVIGVMKLPVEVLEEIFSYVDDHDVINAAYASLQWNTVCQRIARNRCATKIPQVSCKRCPSSRNAQLSISRTS